LGFEESISLVFNDSLESDVSEKEVNEARVNGKRRNVRFESRKGSVGDSDEKVGTDLAGGERRGLLVLGLGEK